MSISRSSFRWLILVAWVMAVGVLAVGGTPRATGGQEATPVAPRMSDEAFVFHPSLAGFNVADALHAANSGLLGYEETIDGQIVGAAETVEAIAREYSLSPKLLLALLEWRGGLVSATATDRATIDQAFGYTTPGLAAQLDTAARALFDAFYAYRADPSRAPEIPNAATAALAALPATGRAATATDAADFAAVFARLFGDPLRGQLILAPPTGPMPGARLPWPAGETWNYNSGPHNYYGGTEGCSWRAPSGCPEPWSSIDVAPMIPTGCLYDKRDPGTPDNDNDEGEKYSDKWAVAVRGGQVSHGAVSDGNVIIDHGDGWSTYYTHLAPTDKVAPGPIDQRRGGWASVVPGRNVRYPPPLCC
ncbi:MAG: hypothetical protein IPH95_11230 [Candidatus Promineofilum sp.]|nr:hypothetical protein [Promineifilum sp.]